MLQSIKPIHIQFSTKINRQLSWYLEKKNDRSKVYLRQAEVFTKR